MPSTPVFGEGMIRTFDLLKELQADISTAYATLESDRASQYLRRCVVRAVFSYIEAVIETVKVELRSEVRTGLYTGNLTDKEKEALGPLHVVGADESGKFLPLDANVKRTFKLAAKIWGLEDFKLSTDGEDFRDFLSSKAARNKLTHPRRYYDIQVTDYDMHCHTIAGMWMRAEFHRLLDARVRAIERMFTEEDRVALRQAAKMMREDFAGNEPSQ